MRGALSPIFLGRFTAISRLVIGSGFLIWPQPTMRRWIGRDAEQETARLLARVVGSRDVVLALGTLTAKQKPRWLAAALAADAADLLLTLESREHLPRLGGALVVAVAGGGVALGAAALAGAALASARKQPAA